jgi:DNA polymerase I-like protein with 3'-5' exonuclease and polymerase domains
MEVVDSLSYKSFIQDIRSQDVFIDYVLDKNGIHTADNSVMLLFVKNIKNGKTHVVNTNHQDISQTRIEIQKLVGLVVDIAARVFVVYKKRFVNLFKKKNVNDILIFEFQQGYESTDLLEFRTDYHSFIGRELGETYIGLNHVIPLTKHVERFQKMFNHFEESLSEFESDYSFEKINGVITETLSDVEVNGIYIDVDIFNHHFSERGIVERFPMVYSEYNLFTSTGRPSNRFAKVNYAALNKDDGSRSAFISRFGSDGVLVCIDYSAYHPHIVANLINFKLEPSTNVYAFLGKSFFNKEELTTEEIKLSKNLTFQNFYGGIRPEYMGIEFFKKTSDYIDHRWNFFLKNGYVETPVFKRRITSHHISDPNPNKLFNYLLQAAETEFSIQNISRVNDFLKTKQSKVILYTYDSILIDVSREDGNETVIRIKDIMIDNQFPVKCHVGKNYNDLCEIELKQ